MASIDKRPNGRWRARYRTPAGESRSRIFDRKADAQRFLAEVEVTKGRGQWIDPRSGRMTFDQWCDEYMAGAVHKRRSTLTKDKSVIANHLRPALGRRQLGSITPLDVQRLVQAMSPKLAPSTVLIAVTPAYDDAVLHFLATGEPWEGGPAPVIGDPLYLPLHEELRRQYDDMYRAVPEGDPWHFVLPTSLVYLDDSSVESPRSPSAQERRPLSC